VSKKSSSRPAEKMLKILVLPAFVWVRSLPQPMPCGLLHPAAPVLPPLALPGDGSARLDAPVLPEVRATPHPLPPKRLAALRYAVTLTKRAV